MMLLFFLLTRFYWPIDVAQYAQAGSVHTHVQVDGYVTYVANEDDGDLHIRICDSPAVTGMDTDHCVIAECIPRMPCTKPALRLKVRVQGISRFDPEHKWREVHPVEAIGLAP